MPATLDAEFARHRDAFAREPFPDAAASDRRCLDRLEALVKDHADEWAGAIARDFGNRSRHETQLLEIFPCLEGRAPRAPPCPALDEAASARSTSLWFLPGRSRVVPQPLGVVGIVVPWNYPLYLAVGPLVAGARRGQPRDGEDVGDDAGHGRAARRAWSPSTSTAARSPW